MRGNLAEHLTQTGGTTSHMISQKRFSEVSHCKSPLHHHIVILWCPTKTTGRQRCLSHPPKRSHMNRECSMSPRAHNRPSRRPEQPKWGWNPQLTVSHIVVLTAASALTT